MVLKQINGYEAPVAEVVAIEIEGAILSGSPVEDMEEGNLGWGQQ